MSKIITFGEIMLRLAPTDHLRFTQADSFSATYAGGEANVAVSLANFGENSAFVSKVPNNEIGQCAINALRKYGVDTSKILRGGKRLGIYFLEKGASQRPSKIIYDRSGSSIAEAAKNEFNWDQIFESAQWFHFTGITPALGDNIAEICLEACKKAKERKIIISCDLNYRNKLWSREKANRVMSELCKYVDICIANEEDAADVFDIYADDTNVINGKINKDGYISVAKKLHDRFNFSSVAITLRSSISADDNKWMGLLFTENQAFFSKEYMIHIIDRIGSGDSFGGALIYAMLNQFNPQNIIDFAVAASCLKHTIEGDFNQVGIDEVMSLHNGNLSGRVQR